MLTKLEEHYTSFFGPHTSTRVDLAENTPVDILVFPPREGRDFYTLATRGLSRKKQITPKGQEKFERIEFMLYLPPDSVINFEDLKNPATWACAFLYFTARYVIDKNTFLGDGSVLHTEDNRHISFFYYPFALLTYPLGESKEFFPVDIDGTHIEILSPILITEAEADFGSEKGYVELINAMVEKDNFNPIFQPLRPCTFKDTNNKISDEQWATVERLSDVEEHFAAHFGKPVKTYEFSFDDASGTDRGIAILVYPPSPNRNFYTITTSGVSDKSFPPQFQLNDFRLEFIAYMPPDWLEDSALPENVDESPLVVTTLGRLARFALGAKKHKIGPNFIQTYKNPPVPIQPGGTAAGLLVASALFEKSEVSCLTRDNGEIIHLCQVIPISAKEIEAALNGVNLIEAMKSVGALDQFTSFDRPCSDELARKGQKREHGFWAMQPAPLNLPPGVEPKVKPPINRTAPARNLRPKSAAKPIAKSVKSASAVERRNADREQEILAVAKAAQKKGCVISTAVFLAVCFAVGSDWWDKSMPMGSGIILFLAVLIIGIIAPFRYAKIKAKEFTE